MIGRGTWSAVALAGAAWLVVGCGGPSSEQADAGQDARSDAANDTGNDTAANDDAGDGPDATPQSDGPPTATAVIGPAGGTISLPDGFTVEFPPDTLAVDTSITVSHSATAPPTGAVTPLYRVEPVEALLMRPVWLSVPLPVGLGAGVGLLWQAPGSAAAECVGGTVASAKLTAGVVRLGEGFAGPSPGTHVVRGLSYVTRVRATDVAYAPEDLTGRAITALVPNGMGGLSQVDAVTAADGTFSLADIPDSPATWILRLGSSHYVTTANALDLGYSLLGRANGLTAGAGTTMSLTVAGLDTWQTGSELLAGATNVDSWWFALSTATNAPQPGDTSLTGLELAGDAKNYDRQPNRLIDGDQGDGFVLMQLSPRLSGNGVPYVALVRVFEPLPFTEVNGAATNLTGTFSNVSQAGSVSSIDFRGSELAALRTSANPSAVVSSSSTAFSVAVHPGGLEHGLYNSKFGGVVPDVLRVLAPNDTEDVTATDLHYGLPTVGTWGLLGSTIVTFEVPIQLGTAEPTTAYAAYSEWNQLDAFTTGPIGVRLSQPRAPTVNGADLFQSRTGVSTTPTLAWDPPTTGTPVLYRVLLYRLYTTAGLTLYVSVATFDTASRSVTIPAGVMSPGETYFVRVSAVGNGEPRPLATPNRRQLPLVSASLVSAPFTP